MTLAITTPSFTALGNIQVVILNLEAKLSDGYEITTLDRQEIKDMLKHLRAAHGSMQVKEPDLSELKSEVARLEADNAGLRGMARELVSSL